MAISLSLSLTPPAPCQNGQKQTDPGSLEDLSRDETDRAVPLSEPITIQRRSPLIRNHKTGSMEVMSADASGKTTPHFFWSASLLQQTPVWLCTLVPAGGVFDWTRQIGCS